MTHHFVMVHGSCHGAWCWYKLVTLLKAAGNRATALDLGGSGVSERPVDDVTTLDDYLQPLMEFMAHLPQEEDEKVILIGHSFGGFGVAFAMEKFPEKIKVAVFVTAMMPNTSTSPGLLTEETLKRTTAEECLDTTFWFDNGAEKPPTSLIMGLEMLSKSLYQLCQAEDLELAKMLVRRSGLFQDDLVKESLLTEEKFGSVDRVFVMCEEDQLVKMDFQKWIIENSPPKQVKSIAGADHMVMLSKPKELCLCLVEIADEYPNK